MKSRITRWIAGCILIGLSLPTLAQSSEDFRPDAEKLQLLEKAFEPWNSVRSWLIEYEGIPSKSNAELIPVHKIMGVSDPGNFYHLSAHFPPNSNPWQADPYCQEFIIHDHKIFHRWTFNRVYSEATIKAGDYIPGTTWMDVLLSIMPRWPLTEYKMPEDPSLKAPVILAQALGFKDYHMLKAAESVGGENCVIFDYKGIDRIWVATNKSFCFMRRDIRDPQSKRLLETILTDEVQQVGPGLWLPKQFRTRFFRLTNDSKENSVERENVIRILHCALNENVNEAIFTPTLRPGSLKAEDGKEFKQTTEGGEDLLSDVVGFMTKYAHLPSDRAQHHRSYIWLLCGLGLGFTMGLWLIPKKEAKPAKVEAARLETV